MVFVPILSNKLRLKCVNGCFFYDQKTIRNSIEWLEVEMTQGFNVRKIEDALSARIAELEGQLKDQCDTTLDLARDICELSASNAKLLQRIADLQAAGDGLVEKWMSFSNPTQEFYCIHCSRRVSFLDESDLVHSPDCPVEKWKAVRGD